MKGLADVNGYVEFKHSNRDEWDMKAFARTYEPDREHCRASGVWISSARVGFHCTRVKGHDGPHVAHSGVLPVATWRDEDIPKDQWFFQTLGITRKV